MRSASRLQVATAATALFIGGTVAGGFALRPDDPTSASAPASATPQVIHKRKVRTIQVPAGSAATGSSAPTAVTATPVSAPAPSPVTSRTSPAGGGGGGAERESGEVERGESD